eukprot:snap_masked-scaffold_49-processed-gene-0.16-mRNA-1 protein AED:1.00 eAED:1.00 QI:0/-1/0/0/-1/1/1/0/220
MSLTDQLQLNFDLYKKSSSFIDAFTTVKNLLMNQYFLSTGLTSVDATSKLNLIEQQNPSDPNFNGIKSPNANLPGFLCFLLPCLNNTIPMVAYLNCKPDEANILRDADVVCTDYDALVVGDVIEIYPGAIVPADCVLVEAKVDKNYFSIFENREVKVCVSQYTGGELELCNVVFAGCLYIEGSKCLKAVVLSTGMETLMGQLILKKQWPLGIDTKDMSIR